MIEGSQFGVWGRFNMRVGFGVHLKGILMILPDLEQRVWV